MTWNHISVKKDLVSKDLWWLVGGGGDVKHENLVRKELMGVKLPRYFEGARRANARNISAGFQKNFPISFASY